MVEAAQLPLEEGIQRVVVGRLRLEGQSPASSVHPSAKALQVPIWVQRALKRRVATLVWVPEVPWVPLLGAELRPQVPPFLALAVSPTLASYRLGVPRLLEAAQPLA